jgi:hypothetical protein
MIEQTYRDADTSRLTFGLYGCTCLHTAHMHSLGSEGNKGVYAVIPSQYFETQGMVNLKARGGEYTVDPAGVERRSRPRPDSMSARSTKLGWTSLLGWIAVGVSSLHRT